MFAHNGVNTLWELKQLILSHLGPEGGREIGNLAYQFQALTADDRLDGFRPFIPPTVPAPSMLLALEDVTMRDYNSGDDSDYEDESSYASTEKDEEVPNTPTVGGPRLILPTPLPIPDFADVPSYFQ
ncbi:hypothetical protein PIB30_009835 [Stylosanthes scabra]|uniref:Uncharacterized protein n=1 Tax=Stylosanthes scabra TaxID=79078 RepID=A0ABU6Q582_9FABA|nr:hypothetical protein [Stylosanthes scabra]